jgi:two-component system, NarL family, sensor histidine kinase BarA
MISPTINFRVLLLAVVPTTAVSIIFFSYFVNKQIDDIENNIVSEGKSLSTHLASASEYGIFSGNMALLSPLIESALKEHNVISITVTNNRGTPLIQKTRLNKKRTKTTTLTDTHNRVFSQPVIQSSIDINDYEESNTSIPQVIGWVVVEVSNEIAVQSKQQAIIQTFSVALIILLTSIFLATRISRHISGPISSLTKAVNEIENGNLGVSINTHSTGAILTLEKGVHSMLQSIKSSQRESQQRIDHATQELRESLELLEHQNSELTITRQQALSANQAKSAFLANISHEIKTPMNGILGFVKLLKGSNPSQEQADYLYTIEQSADNLLHIINDVLDLSKIEAGKLSLHNIHFNLESCIEDVLALIAPSAHDKDIEIAALFYDDTPKELFGAADRVRQILINLIGNAIKFSDSGTIMVRVMLESQKSSTLKIKITVTDQGDGISEKDKTALFRSFSQVNESDTRQYGGAGLGLAISKSLAEAMHGDIGVDSRKDEGSTFWFSFECQHGEAAEEIDEVTTLAYSGKSVSIYDANELTRLSLAHDFRHQGFEVTECLHIDDLIKPPRSNTTPDICVLSLNSDEANNSEIQTFLQAHQHLQQPKFLALVSSSNPLTLKTLRSWGADGCLSKPFRCADFEKKLGAIMHGNGNDISNKLKTKTNKSAQLEGLNILIAEDNAINSKLIETILKRAGAKPTLVNNGKKAISAFMGAHYDAILMDIHMPEMNGINAARTIRVTEGNATHIPIIGLTAISQTKDKSLYENPDFDETLEKPIAIETLLHRINYWTQTNNSHLPSKTANQAGRRLGIDKQLSSTLDEMLLRELPESKEKLQAAFERGDTTFIRNETHRLLGGMAYCKFDKLQALTLQFQTSLKARDSRMSDDMQKMFTEIDRLTTVDNT